MSSVGLVGERELRLVSFPGVVQDVGRLLLRCSGRNGRPERGRGGRSLLYTRCYPCSKYIGDVRGRLNGEGRWTRDKRLEQ